MKTEDCTTDKYVIYAQLRLAIPNSFVYIVITKDEGPEKKISGREIQGNRRKKGTSARS